MGMMKEFKEFAMKGNVVDLAVGVIIGAAFGKIVDSVVKDLIMPVVGILFHADFTNLYIPLNSKVSDALSANPDLALDKARELGPVLAWGNFITIVLNFIILAFVIFLMVKAINKMKKKEEDAAPAPAPEPTNEEKLLGEIRDLLKK
ncbi:MAG: large conductance mechanosensitive channel protein MscL [Sphingobacteriales bacterium JAD_PAG50586_3]|nr:MAG: large conductance mechanosensitive channel protein MscL [Sphingobacteriales bacterium JAD_PAG50586_3]